VRIREFGFALLYTEAESGHDSHKVSLNDSPLRHPIHIIISNEFFNLTVMSQTSTVTEEKTTTKLLSTRDEDEIYTIDELIKRRALELRDSPIFGYPREGLIDYEEHSASALDKYVDAAAYALQRRGLIPVVSATVHLLFYSRCEIW